MKLPTQKDINFKMYLLNCVKLLLKDVQTTASMALDVIRHAQSTVEIIIATYLMEPVLHVDQDGQMKLVKQSAERVCTVNNVVSNVMDIVKIMQPVIT